MEIIDFHTQVLPQSLSGLLPDKGRTWARIASQPISEALHETYPYLRFLPSLGRKVFEGVADRVLPVPFLLLESSAEDLREAMAHSNVSQAVVIADPPRIPNEFVLELASRNPALIPCVQIARSEADPKGALTNYQAQGARVVKISDVLQLSVPGSRVIRPEDTTFFESVAGVANAFKMPVILRISNSTRLRGLLSLLSDTPVILAHMNQNDSETAFDVAEEYPQVHLETSWQPVEVIAEAVRRIGADRVVFGSDWPWMGNNIQVSLRRVREAALAQLIREEDAQKILGLNARRILGG